ncbi:hypothetical protein VDGL01_05502 [Verticillium dahliae]
MTRGNITSLHRGGGGPSPCVSGTQNPSLADALCPPHWRCAIWRAGVRVLYLTLAGTQGNVTRDDRVWAHVTEPLVALSARALQEPPTQPRKLWCIISAPQQALCSTSPGSTPAGFRIDGQSQRDQQIGVRQQLSPLASAPPKPPRRRHPQVLLPRVQDTTPKALFIVAIDSIRVIWLYDRHQDYSFLIHSLCLFCEVGSSSSSPPPDPIINTLRHSPKITATRPLQHTHLTPGQTLFIKNPGVVPAELRLPISTAAPF